MILTKQNRYSSQYLRVFFIVLLTSIGNLKVYRCELLVQYFFELQLDTHIAKTPNQTNKNLKTHQSY